MSGLAVSARAFGAVMRRDLHVYLSYRTRLVSQVMTSLFSLTLFYYVSRLVQVSGFGSPDDYFGYVVVGIALVSVLYSCFSIAEMVRQELVAGTFERLLLSPFGGVRSVLAMSCLPARLRLLHGRRHARPRLGDLRPRSALGDGAAGACRRCCWRCSASYPSAIVFAALTVATKQGSVGTSWVIALISIVGGLYFPVTLLPRMGAGGGQGAAIHAGDGNAAPPAGRQPDGNLDGGGRSRSWSASRRCCCRSRCLPSTTRSGSASGAGRSSSTEMEPVRTPEADRPVTGAGLGEARLRVPQSRRLPQLPLRDRGAESADRQVPRLEPDSRARCSRRSSRPDSVGGRGRPAGRPSTSGRARTSRATSETLCRALLERGLVEADADERLSRRGCPATVVRSAAAAGPSWRLEIVLAYAAGPA